MFSHRKLAIATKHGKEQVIAPLATQYLGVTCLVPSGLDTDVLGTFTGETERTLDPVEAARQKCLLAMAATGCDLAIANEGSFGPHPSVWFAMADDEVLFLLDKKLGLEVWVREISLETNFGGREISSLQALQEFAECARFPTHALILRSAPGAKEHLRKGITTWQELVKTYTCLLDTYGSAYAETDMRAHYNPSRMKVIAQGTEKLLRQVTTYCLQCQRPGFGVSQVIRGLPCGLCGAPTQSVKSLVSTCKGCGFTKEEVFPGGVQKEDPAHCQVCNP